MQISGRRIRVGGPKSGKVMTGVKASFTTYIEPNLERHGDISKASPRSQSPVHHHHRQHTELRDRAIWLSNSIGPRMGLEDERTPWFLRAT